MCGYVARLQAAATVINMNTKRHLPRRTIAAVIFVLIAVLTTPFAGTSTSHAAGNTGFQDYTGGTTGGPSATTKNCTTTSPNCNPVVCNKATGGAKWAGFSTTKDYFVPRSPLCDGATRTVYIDKCIVGFDEVRIYGTKSNPVQASSLSRVYTLDWCLPGQTATGRVYLPNPKDAGPVPVGTVWNSGSPGNSKAQYFNARGEQIAMSDFCATPNNPSKCTTTSIAPRATQGKCTSVMTQGANSIRATLQSGTAEQKAAIRAKVFTQYSLAKSSGSSTYSNAHAAAVADLPLNGLNAPVVNSPDDIVKMGNGYDCSSIFNFIPAYVPKGSAVDPVVLGACVSQIYLPARRFVDPRTLENSWSYWNPIVNTANVPRYSAEKVQMKSAFSGLDTSLAAAVTPSGSRLSSYLNTVRKLVTSSPESYVGDPYNKVMDTGGYFFPKSIDGNGIEAMLWGSDQKPAYDTLSATEAGKSAAAAASCASIELAPEITTPPTGEPKTTTTTDTTPGTYKPTGPVEVVVEVESPKIFTVGGTSRPQTVKVTKVTAYCDGHVCNPSSESDARVSTPIGALSVAAVNGYTECSNSSQKNCDLLVIKPSGLNTLTNRQVDVGFYSPTRASEKVRIGLQDTKATVTPRYLYTPPQVCTTTSTTDAKGKVTTSRSCVQPPSYWRDGTPYTLSNFKMILVDGGPTDRAVSGSIGK